MQIQNVSIKKKDIVLMAKKMKPERKNVSFRLNGDLYDSLMEFCEKNEVSSANVIEALIEKLLNDKKD
jgi:predicted DNA-binding protein